MNDLLDDVLATIADKTFAPLPPPSEPRIRWRRRYEHPASSWDAARAKAESDALEEARAAALRRAAAAKKLAIERANLSEVDAKIAVASVGGTVIKRRAPRGKTPGGEVVTVADRVSMVNGGEPGSFLGVSKDRVETVMTQALPVMGGMASQNVLNLADSVMVGRLGTEAVAGVGLASSVNFQCQAALQGISSGVQAMSARRIGENRPEVAAVPLNAALVIIVLLGVPMAIAAFVSAPSVVPTLTADPAVVASAVPYLRARVCAVPAVGINFAFRGFWNAVQQPQIYMNTLLAIHTVNVSVSLALIFGVPALKIPALGVLGAGVGTATSVWLGSLLYIRMGFIRAKEMGFGVKLPSADDFKTLIAQAAPTSITNLLFATGMTTLYWIVGKLGTSETAAVNVLINLMLTLVLPCMGMGLAAGALSGRALGRGDVEDATQWPWDVSKLTAAMMVGVGAAAAFFPETLLRCFLTDPAAVAKATLPLRFTGATVAFDAVSLTMQNALLGVGDAPRVAFISIATQWLLFLPAAFLGVTRCQPWFNMNWLWGLYVAQRVLQSILYTRLWHAGKWKSIKLA